MNIQQKLSILADAAKYDASCASSGSQRKRMKNGIGDTNNIGICHSYTPDGRCVSLLKILLTNFCIFDCSYCVNRVSSDVRRARFTVSEVVWLTLEFYKRNYIEGLFLSSGIFQSSDHTMNELIEVARKLRVEHKFGGYIHLKAVAGASEELLQRAGLWADRLSANIELPLQEDLNKLAPAKTFQVIEKSMEELQENISESKEDAKKTKAKPRFAPAGQTTQMIVGATPSTDTAILQTASRLYSKYSLRRVYYSAFSPIPHADSRLPLEAPPLVREHRLYQADWLLRYYDFKVDEVVGGLDEGNLDLRVDPKLSWALRNLHFFPLDVNRASKTELLRVPGFGVRTVEKILKARRFQRIRFLDLFKFRADMEKAKYFVETLDKNEFYNTLSTQEFSKIFLPKPKQKTLFEFYVNESPTETTAVPSVISGEL